MNKKTLSLFLMLSFTFSLICSTFAYGSQAPASKKKGTLEILSSLDYPPYEFSENGVAKGISIDVTKEALRRIGYDVTIKQIPWSRALDMMKKGQSDLVLSANISKERLTFLDFTTENIATETVAIFVKKGSKIKFDGDFFKLKDKNFGIVRGHQIREDFDKAVKDKTLKVQEANNTELGIKMLLSGMIDMYIENKYSVYYTLQQMKKTSEVVELKPPVSVLPSYDAFSKKRNLSSVVKQLDKQLRAMKKDGSYNKIVNKYLK